MHASRIVILTGFLIASASLFLAFVTAASHGSFNGIEGAAWPAVVILAPLAAAALVGDRREGFALWGTLLTALVAGLATLFAVQKLVDAIQATRVLQSLGVDATTGWGPWLLLTGTIGVLVGAGLSLSRRLG